MTAPPQGYIANSLSTSGTGGAFVLTIDSNGNFAVQRNGTTIAMWNNLGDFHLSGKALVIDTNQFILSGSGEIAQIDGVNTIGDGVPGIYGLDNRSSLVAADGSPITLYAVPAGAGQLFRITADIFATVVSAGTANYTISWTENAQTKTLVVSASVVNTLATGTDLINADASTNITAQLTFAGFTGTVKVAAVVEQLA